MKIFTTQESCKRKDGLFSELNFEKPEKNIVQKYNFIFSLIITLFEIFNYSTFLKETLKEIYHSWKVVEELVWKKGCRSDKIKH